MFYSLGVLILLLVNYAVQQDGGDDVSPGLIRAGKEEVEGGGDQTSWTLKNGVLDNFPGTPVLTDDVHVLANLGGDVEKTMAAAAAIDDHGRPPEAQHVVQECQIDDSSRAPAPSRTRRRQNNGDKPLICPAQPPPPSSQQEEEKPSPDSSNSQSSEGEEKADPWQLENEERRRLIPKFDYNNGICSGKDYGYKRLIPVCDSGIDFFRIFRFSSRDWNLRDVRPCRSKTPTSSTLLFS